MSTAKIIEITSESEKGYDDAIRQGIAEASRTVENIQGAWVKNHEVLVGNGESPTHRVQLKVTFVVNPAKA